MNRSDKNVSEEKCQTHVKRTLNCAFTKVPKNNEIMLKKCQKKGKGTSKE